MSSTTPRRHDSRSFSFRRTAASLSPTRSAAKPSLSDEKLAKVKEIKREAMRHLMEGMLKVRSTAAVKELQKKRDEFAQQALGVLPAEQSQLLEKLKGSPFRFKQM
jgi:hypothetical protein